MREYLQTKTSEKRTEYGIAGTFPPSIDLEELSVNQGKVITEKKNFSGSNTDGSFTTAVSTFLDPLEKSNSRRLRMIIILIEMIYNVYTLESPQ